jgi:hypothetical protein
MGFLSKMLFGGGRFKDEMRAELESEGVVLLEEGLRGSLNYKHFKAPGKRFNGKRVPMKLALAMTEKRIVCFGGVGAGKVIDSEWTAAGLDAVTVELESADKVAFHVDYDRMGQPKVSGLIIVRVQTPSAPLIAEHFNARRGRSAR